MTTLVPAYGRDYKSKSAVLADWQADKDFVIADYFNPDDGKYVNRPQLTGKHMIRYAGLRKIMQVVAMVLLATMLSGCALSSSFTVSGQHDGQVYSASVLAK